MKKSALCRFLTLALFIQLVISCRLETVEPDSEERQPLFIKGLMDSDSFSFSNESEYFIGESRSARRDDTIREFIFSFTDSRSPGRKIEIRFLSDIRRFSPSIDSAIRRGFFPYYSRNSWGRQFERAVEISWYEGSEEFSSSHAFQVTELEVTDVKDLSWNGVNYRLVRLSAACSLYSDPGGGGIAKELQFDAQVAYKDDG